jgi:hypothetical protein
VRQRALGSLCPLLREPKSFESGTTEILCARFRLPGLFLQPTDKLGRLVDEFKRRLTVVVRLLLDPSLGEIQNVVAVSNGPICIRNLNTLSQPMREGHGNLL